MMCLKVLILSTNLSQKQTVLPKNFSTVDSKATFWVFDHQKAESRLQKCLSIKHAPPIDLKCQCLSIYISLTSSAVYNALLCSLCSVCCKLCFTKICQNMASYRVYICFQHSLLCCVYLSFLWLQTTNLICERC